MEGAIREDDTAIGYNPHDDPYSYNGPSVSSRVLNHFFDPYWNSPLTTTFGIALGDTTPNWALGSADAFNSPNTANQQRYNHFSVLDAREAMYRALTGRDKDGNSLNASEVERNKYWATTFRALACVS
jgi:hypothetical protein